MIVLPHADPAIDQPWGGLTPSEYITREAFLHGLARCWAEWAQGVQVNGSALAEQTAGKS